MLLAEIQGKMAFLTWRVSAAHNFGVRGSTDRPGGFAIQRIGTTRIARALNHFASTPFPYGAAYSSKEVLPCYARSRSCSPQ
jgi:hypothetical protein